MGNGINEGILRFHKLIAPRNDVYILQCQYIVSTGCFLWWQPIQPTLIIQEKTVRGRKQRVRSSESGLPRLFATLLEIIGDDGAVKMKRTLSVCSETIR